MLNVTKTLLHKYVSQSNRCNVFDMYNNDKRTHNTDYIKQIQPILIFKFARILYINM